ncbi:MAG: hypothetical protein ABIM50_02965 [Novosphingobium sp.]
MPLPDASAAPFEWHVHSAADDAATRSGSGWIWLVAAAFLLGAAVMLLVQQILRRRRAEAASAEHWDYPAEVAAPPATLKPVAPHAMESNDPRQIEAPAVPAVSGETQPVAQPALDLLSIMAEPENAVPALDDDSNARPTALPAAPGELLTLELSARRLSATLMNTVLNYELTVSNTGPDAVNAIVIGGDMIAAHASLPSRAQLELGGNSIAPLHTIAALEPGESLVLKGEFKLPLTAITPIRNGNAALFIPLARFRLEAMGKFGLPFSISRTFVVGEDQDRPGAALKPFRLDLGPRLYSHIGQRELALSA